jgi:Rad3-related DNA helicase
MKSEIVVSRDTIEECVKDWVFEKISKNFKFRKYQLECIINIIDNILSHGNHNYVVEAPTGSGKSLINLIAAGVLADYWDVTSYLLVSDLFLWEQYSDFLMKHKKMGIAMLKGKIGNYKCMLNGEDITLADCTLSGLSWASMYNMNTIKEYGYDCAHSCQYVKARKKAVKSKVCLMTYQLFIQTFKMINPDENNPYQFKYRDVIFCDECHNIPSIVEQRVHAHIKEKDLNILLDIYDYVNKKDLDLFGSLEEDDSNKLFIDMKRQDIIDEFNNCWSVLSNPESRKDEDMSYRIRYNDLLDVFVPICEEIRNRITLAKKNKQHLSKEDLHIFGISNWFWDYALEFREYMDIIQKCGKEYQLKEIAPETRKEEGPVCTFRCLKEDYLVYKYLLNKAQWRVMLSATIGGHEAFDENMGFTYTEDKNSKMETIPSTFDFEKSPVHFLNKFKMSLKEREMSFLHLKNAIYSICKNKFQDQRGIIQTGSYDIAKKLYDQAPLEVKQRMLVYNGSLEKNSIIKIHQISDNTILVGPTLNEGIDLPGDECRFIIIMKVPYPSLGDRYVKEKIKYYPLWYNSTTSNEIIQGIGRGVRFDGDWCVTYIFDACFWNLYCSTKEQYPKELQDRIKII